MAANVGGTLRLPWSGRRTAIAAAVGALLMAVVLVIRAGGSDGYATAYACTGLLLTTFGLNSARSQSNLRRMSGVGVALIGAGQIGAAALALLQGPRFPTWIELAAAAAVIPGAFIAGRATVVTGMVDRTFAAMLLLEIGVLTLVFVFVGWTVLLSGWLNPADHLAALVFLCCAALLLALPLVRFAHAPEPSMLAVSIAALGITVGHILTLLAQVVGGVTLEPLLTPATSLVLLVGLYQLDETVLSSAEMSPAGEFRRSLLVMAAGMFVPFAVFVLLVVQGRVLQLSWTMTVLYTCILFGVGAREIVRAGQSRLLLAQLRSQAREHPITGLGNALALREDLDVRAARQASAALFLLDLGRVKDISGRRGSRAGEEVLTAVAQALCEFADDNDHVSVFQLSGDDFAVVADANDIALDQGVLALRQAVRQATEKLVSTAHSALVPSIGIAVMGGPRVPRPRLGEETASSAASPSGAGDVLGHAAHALAVARHEAGGTCVYSAELTCKEERRAQIESGLRKALRYGGVQAHFQPIIEMTSGKVIGLEALARWHDHELGNVSPGEFIPVAEEVGLIPDIGLVVLEQAVEMSGRLRAEGKPVYVSVNVSPLQLVQDGFVQAVSDSLARHRVDPYYVVIEVTEGIFVDQESRAVRMLGELSQLGVRIALDDFGSGYSSLGYMSRLPLQVVKIDRSLVSRVLQTRPMAVVAGILDLCAALHLSVVVEGVETQAESDQLVALGAVQGQGWLWSPATSADKLPGLLDERGVREMGGQVLGPRAIEV